MSKKNPLVTIIAICYNHENFISECLQSVVNQTYSPIELIIVDDCSKDQSREKILEFYTNNSYCRYIFNPNNIGNCKSFNQAFKISKGKYIIDLSTDDVLLPTRIEEQVSLMECSGKVGVVFSDANFINKESKQIGNFKKNLILPIGNVYKEVLAGCCYTMPVSAMMRRTILEQLNGYDTELSYEDFDFWIRSSRICEFGYVPKILSYQRITNGSLSTSFFVKHSPLVISSVAVCQKAYLLNATESENKALAIRLRFVLLRCALTENFKAGEEVLDLLNKTRGHNWKTVIGRILIYFKIPINSVFVLIMNIRRFLRYEI